MEKLNKLLTKNQKNYNHATFKEIDALFSFAVDAATDHKQPIYKSPKEGVRVTVTVKSVTSAHVQTSCDKLWDSLKSRGKTREMAMENKYTQMIYCPTLGECPIKKLPEHNRYFLHETENEDVKQAYELRASNLQAICDLFVIPSTGKPLCAKDLYYSDTLICRAIAHMTMRHFKGAERVTAEEAIYLNGATRGAIQCATKGKIHDCYDYDINSMYPYMLTESNMRVPLTTPTIEPVDKTKPITREFGVLEIYHLEILSTHDYFRTTPDNKYNTYQISLLDELKMKYKIVGDKKLVYRNCVLARDIFSYLKPIYELKKNGNANAKAILNVTWGVLSRAKDYEVPLDNLREHDMKNVKSIDVNRGLAIMNSDDRPFKHVTGRLKCFLLAYARLYIVRTLLLKLEKAGHTIYQCNTDGFITDATPDEVTEIYPIHDDIGCLKIAKVLKGKHDIMHVRRVDKDEDENGD